MKMRGAAHRNSTILSLSASPLYLLILKSKNYQVFSLNKKSPELLPGFFINTELQTLIELQASG
jgi:hypothetical protein